jgi:phage shock protein A
MGILERTKHVIRADLNDLLKKAKNPLVVLDAYLDDLEVVMAEAISIRDAEEAERGIYAARLRDLNAVMKSLEQKAVTCLKRGDEELARTALERKLDIKDDVDELEQELEQRAASLDILKESVRTLKVRIGEVNRRRRELRFRRQIVQARSELQESMSRLGYNHDESIISQAHDDLTDLEGRLEAEETWSKEGVDDRVLRLEVAARRRQREEAIDSEIILLRRQMKKRKKG